MSDKPRRTDEPVIIDAADLAAVTRALRKAKPSRRQDMWEDDPTACERCGQPHVLRGGTTPSCSGHRKSDGAPCGQPRMDGARVCRKHGGKAPQVQAAAQQRVAEQRAVRSLERFGVPRENVGDPGDVFVELISTSAGLMDYYLERVREEEGPDALVFGVTEQADEDLIRHAYKSDDDDDDDVMEQLPKPISRKTKRQAGPITWLQLYDRERDRLAKLCVDAMAAGVQERRVRLAESMGSQINTVFRAVFAELRLTPEQAALLPQIMPRHLRAIEGGASAGA